YIPSIDMELSQIIQLIVEDNSRDSAAKGYKVQKCVFEANEATVSTFFHMTTVLCAHAFECLPVSIEILSLYNGKKHVYHPDKATLLQSLDYMSLAKSLLPLIDAGQVN
ncbi:hypothetical protein AB4Z21_32005, partial [Paenibacillus sp. MCAF20]